MHTKIIFLRSDFVTKNFAGGGRIFVYLLHIKFINLFATAMKKLLLLVLFLAPLGVSACGLIGYIARPSGEFLERTNDMDHTAVIDLNNGIEDTWFNVKKPAGITDGAILTVTPVHARAEDIHVAGIEKNAMPTYSPYDKVSHTTLMSEVRHAVFDWLDFSVPILLVLTFLTMIVCAIIMVRNRVKGIPNKEIVGRMAGTAMSLFAIVIIFWGGIGYIQQSAGLSGSIISTRGPSGMFVDSSDRVNITYSTITKGMTLQVLSAEDGKGLTNYLERNGLPKSPANEENLTRFVGSGFNFVITYTPMAVLGENERRYVHVMFPSQKLFFPLSVNFDNNLTPHPVHVLVLKPVVIPGYSTDLAKEEQKNLNNAISYYGRDSSGPRRSSIIAPDTSVVHFYRAPKDYNEDVTMDIGIPNVIKFYKILSSAWVTFPIHFGILVAFIYGISILPKKVRKGINIVLYGIIGIVIAIVFSQW